MLLKLRSNANNNDGDIMKLNIMILLLAYQLLVISFAQYPIWVTSHVLKFKKDNANQITTSLTSVSIAVLLIFVVFSNIMAAMVGLKVLDQKVPIALRDNWRLPKRWLAQVTLG